MTRDQKIQAAKDMTEANIEHHRIHLEDGYVEATRYEVMLIVGYAYDIPEFIKFHTPQIWGINKQGKLQMI
jgi:hypothetical protein